MCEIGWTGEDFDDLSELHGKPVSVTTKEKSYQGRSEVEIAFVNAPKPQRIKGKDNSLLLEALRAVRAKMQASRGEPAPRVQPAQQQQHDNRVQPAQQQQHDNYGPGGVDDGIPF